MRFKNILIAAALLCIFFSIMSTGLTSTLFDLCAFLLLCFILFTQKKKQLNN